MCPSSCQVHRRVARTKYALGAARRAFRPACPQPDQQRRRRPISSARKSNGAARAACMISCCGGARIAAIAKPGIAPQACPCWRFGAHVGGARHGLFQSRRNSGGCHEAAMLLASWLALKPLGAWHEISYCCALARHQKALCALMRIAANSMRRHFRAAPKRRLIDA